MQSLVLSWIIQYDDMIWKRPRIQIQKFVKKNGNKDDFKT